MKRLGRTFFKDKDTVALAKALLGKVFVRTLKSGNVLSGIIVETEAYTQEDEACHASRGMTPKNAMMFEKPGTLYVYFTYGMHYCVNVVSEREGRGCAVLIRAVQPLDGESTMARRRKRSVGDISIANGPAKFTQAFGIAREDNGTDVCGKNGMIYIADAGYAPQKIVSTPRIGISRAKEKKWRFLTDLF